MKEQQIIRQIFRRLIRRADHEARADLVAKLLERPKALPAALGRLLRRMQAPVMRGRGSLMPQQITIRARLSVKPVGRMLLFADGERDGAVRPGRFDGADNPADAFVGEVRVLAALEHKSTKAERIAGPAARKDLLLRQPVTLCLAVAAPDAAVIAVAAAVICKLDQPACVNAVAKTAARRFARRVEQVRHVAVADFPDQTGQLCARQHALAPQRVDQPAHAPGSFPAGTLE